MRNITAETGKPLLSVVVPVYNVEAYLTACVESIRRQDYGNLDIILVDDGSTDGCPRLCDIFAKADTRIRVIHKTNGGLSDARNAGLASSRGNLIAFVDADDWLEKDMYTTLFDLMRQHNADIAECGIRYVYPNGKQREDGARGGVCVLDQRAATAAFLDRRVKISASICNKLYKKSIFETLRFQKNRLHEDAFFMYRALYNAHVFVRTARPKYNYRQGRPGSIMTSPVLPKNIRDILDAFEERNAFFEKEAQERLLQKSKNYYYQTLISSFAEASVYLPEEKELLQELKSKLIGAKREIIHMPIHIRLMLRYIVFLVCPKLLTLLFRLREGWR
ncbi:glycosyltransferase [Oscillospiraceae bacterium WX1]